MCATPAEHVNIQLVRLGQQQVGLIGDEGESFQEADSNAAVRHHLRQGERGRLDVISALDNLQVRRNRSQVLVRVLVRQVSETKRLPDLSGREQLLELRIMLAIMDLTLGI